ncbi:MAG TPA: addiction module protein [Gallionellaceae bacterium]|nr:addiction module protein [Gallionellaceae bacterium]HQS75317.1 addiction module protein [Gallionellaceae bacterium]
MRYESEVALKASVLLDEAVSLPVEERAHLVDCLLQTLNPQDDTHAAAWTAVARRRLEELKAGDIAPVDGETVFARIQQRYGK